MGLQHNVRDVCYQTERSLIALRGSTKGRNQLFAASLPYIRRTHGSPGGQHRTKDPGNLFGIRLGGAAHSCLFQQLTSQAGCPLLHLLASLFCLHTRSRTGFPKASPYGTLLRAGAGRVRCALSVLPNFAPSVF